jgi:prepilin-type N-terminal cleavage/methylation domain-containing protein
MMLRRHPGPSGTPGPRSGFTLLELLTAMAVLGLVMAMLTQVINGILGSIQVQSQQMEATGAARRMLDIMDTDLSLALADKSTAVLVKTDAASHGLALLADRRGTVDPHRFLAVRYDRDGETRITRSYASVDFNERDLLTAAASPTDGPVLSDGILAFQIRVNTENETESQAASDAATAAWATSDYHGSPVPSGWKALLTGPATPGVATGDRARSLEVWVAAIDSQNLALVEAGQLTALFGPDPSAWRATVDAASQLPPRVKAGIRILNKTIPLP